MVHERRSEAKIPIEFRTDDINIELLLIFRVSDAFDDKIMLFFSKVNAAITHENTAEIRKVFGKLQWKAESSLFIKGTKRDAHFKEAVLVHMSLLFLDFKFAARAEMSSV